ncbi:hypothetical protein CALVIDRAFT_538145 [Calocera viscosa TUFC12733]|uniref:F-box domain-containing protein n=1 Tax=Calocera viscosa (strain TUFC12733) TaxID=1330018 RepID=A0A167L5Y0_CALVF|nr:hypothetical protein CALVIDRAFT_538145 [Calocera viscosa TUFC12733]
MVEGQLSSVSIHGHHFLDPSLIRQAVQSIATSSSRLKSLSLYLMGMDEDVVADIILPWTTYIPLLQCGNLEFLTLVHEVGVRADIGDCHLDQLGGALHHLTSLTLWPGMRRSGNLRHSDSQGTQAALTLGCMASLAIHCPNLVSLNLENMDASGAPPKSLSRDLGIEGIQLDFRNCPIDSPVQVALYLNTVWPNAPIYIHYESTRDWQGQDRGWDVVDALLKYRKLARYVEEKPSRFLDMLNSYEMYVAERALLPREARG